MKSRQPKGFSKSNGFTIVELLVVVAIILVLSALSFSVGKHMIFKSRAAVMASNMKQMGSFFTAYASDNQQQLLPCRGEIELGDGSFDSDALWHEIILSMLHENTDPARFKEASFWDSNDLFLRNPLFFEGEDPRGFEPLNPGYGYNLMLPENYQTAEGGATDQDSVERTKVPIAFADEPTRTPIIAPADNYFYRYDESQLSDWESGTISRWLVDGSFPVLFLDGHIESVKPQEYIDRRLHEMPLDPDAL